MSSSYVTLRSPPITPTQQQLGAAPLPPIINGCPLLNPFVEASAAARCRPALPRSRRLSPCPYPFVEVAAVR